MKQAKYEEAAEQYRKAIELSPNHADFYNSLGYVFLVKGRYDEAIDQYRKVIELIPTNPDVYNNLGSAFSRQAKYQDAIECYQKAIELDSKYASAYYNLGITFSEQTKYEEAIEQYNKAIELDPTYFFVGKYNSAEIYLITERFDVVLALADEVLNKQDVPAQVILGMKLLSTSALFFQEKEDEAIATLEDFITYYSELPEYDPKDWSYKRSKQFISSTAKLSETEKTLLLTLIDILETPKPQAHSKLQELEILLEKGNYILCDPREN